MGGPVAGADRQLRGRPELLAPAGVIK